MATNNVERRSGLFSFKLPLAVMALASGMLAVVLLSTGIVHFIQPYLFVHSIANYRLLPSSFAGIVGIAIPCLQIVLALCILFNVARQLALFIIIGMFIVFAIAQLSVLMRGLDVDCGCFGFIPSPVSWLSLLVPLSLVINASVIAIAEQQS